MYQDWEILMNEKAVRYYDQASEREWKRLEQGWVKESILGMSTHVLYIGRKV